MASRLTTLNRRRRPPPPRLRSGGEPPPYRRPAWGARVSDQATVRRRALTAHQENVSAERQPLRRDIRHPVTDGYATFSAPAVHAWHGYGRRPGSFFGCELRHCAGGRTPGAGDGWRVRSVPVLRLPPDRPTVVDVLICDRCHGSADPPVHVVALHRLGCWWLSHLAATNGVAALVSNASARRRPCGPCQ